MPLPPPKQSRRSTRLSSKPGLKQLFTYKLRGVLSSALSCFRRKVCKCENGSGGEEGRANFVFFRRGADPTGQNWIRILSCAGAGDVDVDAEIDAGEGDKGAVKEGTDMERIAGSFFLSK